MRISDWSSDVCSSDLEIARRFDLRHRLAQPQAGGVDVGDGVAGHALLPGRGEEDRRTVRGAKVVALAVPRRRVVDLEEELQQLAVADARRVEHDLHRLGRSEDHPSELQSLMRTSYSV